MFRKDFKAKGHTQVKSSDRKKLRQQIQQLYPALNDDILSLIIPTGKGEDFTSCKISLSTGDDILVYSSNKTPWFFVVEDIKSKTERILPTVYLLWKCPDLLPLKFHTHRHVFNKLMNGADLMLPGLILPPGSVISQTFRHVQRDQLCSICLDDNRYPIGIGQTTMDGDDMYMSGMKGRGIALLHIYQDTLWNFGPRTEGPYEKEQRQYFVTDQTKVEETAEPACAEASNAISSLNLDEESAPVSNSNEPPTHPESMDEILDTIFFYLCQRKAKSYELPLLASHFYTIMQDCVPGLTLDLKLSSHKKFSKFLQHQQQINSLIAIEEIKPGVLAISSFTLTKNEQLDSFRTPSWLKNYLSKASDAAAAAAATTESERSTTKYIFPDIAELWKTNSRVNEILDCSSSTHYLRPDEIRQAVRAYVIRNNLNSEKQVKLDPILSRLFKTKDASSTSIGWNELNNAVFNAMSACTEVAFAHLEQPIRINGHISPIEIECVDRNRKRQTFIRYLDTYQIDLSELCKRIRQGASVSAVINETDETRRTGRIVMAQGNQISFVIRVLKDDYGVPGKFIKET
ncbi:unnamed protein product [Rotaria magnacalcarata]|uniref:SUI1 domain-containing protein n=3 Tax=Rotaria magnacalcarata TaxID=392030 RepID=A0A814LLW6_9BILA|nr:unnamed protein product [Rotaria magnacalcarata]CAF1973884.1 unnamed protein product [Rotaria magnacalcarata]CAF4148138.1 unnamed protein product [Rotaria magnacalcarata]CAF4343759.1 unnamed protein product [Rotaria magnacalcarata]